MIVPVLYGVVSLHAQFGGAFPEESRAPMSIRPQLRSACKVDVGGDTWVGQRTAKGGSIRVRDLSGDGVLSASGVLRYYFTGGRFHDQIWRAESFGNPFRASKVPVQEVQFPSGLTTPTKVEGVVLGVLYANGEACGDTGETLKERYGRALEFARQDSDEAVALADKLSPPQFEKAVRQGLLPTGPYSRETSASSNGTIRSRLIAADGSLVAEYKQWLRHWRDSLKPAKSTRQSRSSPPRGL